MEIWKSKVMFSLTEEVTPTVFHIFQLNTFVLINIYNYGIRWSKSKYTYSYDYFLLCLPSLKSKMCELYNLRCVDFRAFFISIEFAKARPICTPALFSDFHSFHCHKSLYKSCDQCNRDNTILSCSYSCFQ